MFYVSDIRKILSVLRIVLAVVVFLMSLPFFPLAPFTTDWIFSHMDIYLAYLLAVISVFCTILVAEKVCAALERDLTNLERRIILEKKEADKK